MSVAFQNIDPPPPHPPPLRALMREEDTLAGLRGGGGSIFWKTPDTALYSTYVSTLWRVEQGIRDDILTPASSVPQYSHDKNANKSSFLIRKLYWIKTSEANGKKW